MDLLLDIGNTNVKWASCRGDELGPAGTRPHGAGGLDGLAEAWRGLQPPRRIWAANVAGDGVAARLESLTDRLWQHRPRFVRTQKHAGGVTIAYDHPERLGVDRWLALIAVHRRYRRPALVADCGTAVTLDAIGENGRHLGGLIVPGLGMMWHCLFERTRIASVEYEEYDGLLGQDTGECISSGSVQAVAGMIERVTRRLNARHGWDMDVVLSGGDAHRIAGLLDPATKYEPDLVLQGLAMLRD